MYNETADDLNKKYHNTILKVNGKVCWISNFEESGALAGQHVIYRWNTGQRGDAGVNTYKPEDIEVIQYGTTFLNNGELSPKVKEPMIPCVLIQRKPKRQWKRGICNENTAVLNPMITLYQLFQKECRWNGTLDIPLVNRLLNPTYPSLKEAESLVETQQAVAISPMFALVLSNISPDKYLICSHFGFVGEVIENHISVKHPPALQEVRDYAQRSQQHITVELNA